jgi:dTDP-4-amino-4,6-dideoxygalactose transaminase
MISKPIPYGRQHITDEDIRAVIDTLKSDYLTQGPKIREFETKFAEYVGAQYAVAVNNATSGLHLAATALNVKPGDKVIVTPMTFAASANCIRYCGGEVVFCDIDKDTYLMDIRKLEAMLKASPRGTYKGIVPVDFAGYPLDLEEFRKLADEYGLWIIEDACHAPGGYFMAPEGEERIGDVSNVLFTNGWIADEDGKVFIYYASSDTRMHVATSTVDKLVDYCMNTPVDGLSSSASVETLKKLIDKNLKLNIKY